MNNSYLPQIVTCPGPQGPEGITGPQGPPGIEGTEGLSLPNNILALQNLGTNVEYTLPDYNPIVYQNIGAQIGNDVTLPTLPGSDPVTLSAGHTYYITFSTMGQRNPGHNDTIFYRVLINGVPFPSSSDINFRWETTSYNIDHSFIYTATTPTTIQYEVGSTAVANLGDSFTLSGSFLTIMTLV